MQDAEGLDIHDCKDARAGDVRSARPGIPAVEAAAGVGESSDESSSSDMTPSVKCSLRGGMTMLSSSPGTGGSFASK